MFNGININFWLAVVGAILVKMITSETHSLKRSITTIITAIFFAWIFTDVTIAHLKLNQETYQIPIAAVLALTGESLARMILSIKSIGDLIEIILSFKGKK